MKKNILFGFIDIGLANIVYFMMAVGFFFHGQFFLESANGKAILELGDLIFFISLFNLTDLLFFLGSFFFELKNNQNILRHWLWIKSASTIVVIGIIFCLMLAFKTDLPLMSSLYHPDYEAGVDRWWYWIYLMSMRLGNMLLFLVSWRWLDLKDIFFFDISSTVKMSKWQLSKMQLFAPKKMVAEKLELGVDLEEKKILLVGAGEAAINLIEEFKREKLLGFLVGMVDDDPLKLGYFFSGIEVMGSLDKIGEMVKLHGVKTILICIESLEAGKLNRIIDDIDPNQVQIKIIPANREQVVEDISLKSMRDLQAEDLIGRDVIELNTDLIEKEIQDKIIFITGAGGSIGSEIAYQLLSLPIKKIICLCRSEYSLYKLQERLERENKKKIFIQYYLGNIKDYERMQEIISTERPDFIFHAAAHKHVPYMEQNEKEAIKNNVFGTENLLCLASEYAIKRFVMISTDKAVNPINIMGASKKIAELLTHYYHQKNKVNVAVVRFGNVLGSRGSVVPLFREQIKAGGPITVTHRKIVRFFMTIREAALLVINASILFQDQTKNTGGKTFQNSGGETFVLDMGKPIKIDSLVRRMARLSGLKPGKDVEVVYTGLRAGEKVQEELFTKSENIYVTINKKIFIVNERRVHLEKIYQWVQQMKKDFIKYNNQQVRDAIKQILKAHQGQRRQR